MPRWPVPPLRRSAGFTLLELLVVLVLIGIIFTFAMLSLGGDDIGELMDQESYRMMTLMNLASDEAVLRGEELAVLFSEDGYEFVVLNNEEGRWHRTEGDGLLKAYSLPADIELRLEMEGEPPILTAAAKVDEEDDDTLGEDEDLQPQVFILSSGEMTPFTVILMSPQSRWRYHLTASLLGTFTREVEETL